MERKMKICDIVDQYSINNIRIFTEMDIIHSLHAFGIPCGMTTGETAVVECLINEDRYKVSDGYKFTLVPVDETQPVGLRHFYQSDFDNLRNRYPEDYKIFILVDHDGKYERFRG